MAETYIQTGLRTILALREGLRDHVYLDSRGIPTGWIGHRILAADNLKVGDLISAEVGEAWFDRDTASAIAAAQRQAVTAGVASPDFIIALADVNFQMGVLWTMKFPHTWALIVVGRYKDACDALDESAWATQTPVRVQDFKKALMALSAKSGVDNS